ncbi:oligosaccharide flippase family protein [uncultured Desulfosarcina sp.]|uniref:oligosaccharide flippase family protein n=1 Tax=uncultured Desulfosarcina sp. TaxID=218289 RepID=UPI0029C6469A|nr:oligosaccharide flippase family protein [uncultured Desulfosarcina sp.]
MSAIEPAVEPSVKPPIGQAGQTAPGDSLRKRALRASVWMLAARPVGMSVQLVRSLILTRLLFPEAFGLMAIVGAVTQAVNMCSDMGLGPSIIQNPRGKEERFLCTAWTIQVLRGVVLWLLCVTLAWPLSWIYGEPMLKWLLPVAGLSVFIGGFNTTAWQTANRDLAIGRVTLLAHGIDITTTAILIGIAWWLRSVWALVISSLVSGLLHVVLGHLILPGVRHRFAWDRAAARELVGFGKWVFVSTLLTLLAMQSDKLMLGGLITTKVLGIYSIALVLAALPRTLVQQFSGTVLFPALSERYRQDPRRMHVQVKRARGVLLRIGLLLTLGAAAIGPAFFHYLYDPRYWAAGWMVQFLAFSMWMTMLNTTTGYSLLSLGDSRGVAIGNAVNVVVTVAAALLGHFWFGLSGFIVGYGLGTGAGEVYQGVVLRRRGIGVLRQDLKFTCVAAAGGAGLLAVYLAERGENWTSMPWVSGVLGLAVWAVVAGVFWPSLRRELPERMHLSKWLGGRRKVASA